MLMLRALLFYLGQALATVVIAALTIASFALPFRIRYAITQLWTRFNIWWLKLVCGVDFQLEGTEHIPDSAAIVLAKHQSTWETLFLQSYLPPVAWVLKKELLKIPLFGWSLALLEPIAIDRSSSSAAVKQILEQGTAYLQKGRWVVIFPEGTRAAPGTRLRYKLGGARLATHSGFPVLPVAHNAGEHWPKRGFIKHPGTIRVVFGPIIESRDKTPEALNAEVEQWIEATVDRISGQNSFS